MTNEIAYEIRFLDGSVLTFSFEDDSAEKDFLDITKEAMEKQGVAEYVANGCKRMFIDARQINYVRPV